MHSAGCVVALSWLGGGVGCAQGETQLCGSRKALSCSVRIAEGFGGGDDERCGCGSQSGLLTAMGFTNSWCDAQHSGALWWQLHGTPQQPLGQASSSALTVVGEQRFVLQLCCHRGSLHVWWQGRF